MRMFKEFLYGFFIKPIRCEPFPSKYSVILFAIMGLQLPRPFLTFIFVLALINEYFTAIAEISYVVVISGDVMENAVTMLACIGVCCLGTIKTVSVIIKRDEINECVHLINNAWPSKDANDDIKAIVERCEVKFHRIDKFYFWSTTGTSIFFLVAPAGFMMFYAIKGGEIPLLLPYAVIYPFDPKSSVFVFIASYVSLIYAGLIGMILISAPDLLMASLIGQLCTLLEVLQYELRYSSGVEQLNEVIKKHQDIIRISDKLNDAFSLPLFFNIIISSFIICLTAFYGILLEDTEVLNYKFVLISMLTQVAVITVYGDRLISSSLGVGQAAMESDWYKENVIYFKELNLLLMRSQKPLCLSAMGFTSISLNTFTIIIKTSYSYFTLLKAVYVRSKY